MKGIGASAASASGSNGKAANLEPEATKHGWVMKQTEDGKRWQKRYLLLHGTRLYYFGKNGEPADKARDVMNLKRASEIVVCPGQPKGAEHGFKIVLPARTFVFALPAEAEQRSWLDVLLKAKAWEPAQDEHDEFEGADVEKLAMPALEMDEKKDDVVEWVDEFDDFPEAIQKVFRKSKLKDEDVVKHIHVILNIVRFLYKKRHYKTHIPNPYEDLVEASAGSSGPGNLLLPQPEGAAGPAAETLAVAPAGTGVGSEGRRSRMIAKPVVPAEDAALFEEAEKMFDEITPKTRKKKFKLMKELGKGGFGTVHLAQWAENKETVAVKCMTHDTARSQRANLREIYWLNKLDHKNIVKLMGSFLCMADMWVVLEYMEGGTLTEAVQTSKFRENEVAYVAREIFTGVAYMHGQNVIHRDLKSANVMMTVKAEIKLIDFGLCGDVRVTKKLKGMVGSPYWMPPEMIRGQYHSNPVDVWSAGVCLLELCNGHAPKMGNAFRAMFSSGSGQVPQLKKPDQWSAPMLDFFSRMLEIDAGARATPSELLEHGFLKSNVASRADMRKKLTEIFQAGAIASAGF